MPAEFTTESTNFLSAMSGAVDPRTGMYGYNISIAHLTGNSGLGPGLSVVLSYSPLNINNNGLGIGITLPLSQYDKDTGTLQLSTGENYKVTEANNTLHLIHAHTLNFRTEIRDDGYYIFHKDGVTEKLSAPDKGGHLKVTENLMVIAV